MHELKLNYEHIRDKQFHLRVGDEYTVHLILGDNTFSRIKTEEVIKGAKRDPLVEGTTFGNIIHGGDKGNGTCMYVSDTEDYERLYSLDILGAEDRSENHPREVYKEFIENIQIDAQGRYEVGIPWIPGNTVTESNEVQSRKRLKNIERILEKDPALKETYQEIVTDQLNQGIIEKAPEVEQVKVYFTYLTNQYAVKMLQQPKQGWYLIAVHDLLQCQTASTSVRTLALHCSQICGTLWSGPEWHQTY